MSREPDFWAQNQIFKNFSKSLKTCLVGVFWVFHGIFSIIRHLRRELDFSAKNRIFKNFSKSLKTCLVGVFWVFLIMLALLDIWAENRMFEPRTGFFSREPDFQKFLKKPQNMFSWCFLSVSWYFSIIRRLSRELDFSAKNWIFKNFLKCHKACLVCVFWVFQSIF